MTISYEHERTEVLRAQQRCWEQKLQSGNGGNVSVRIAGTDRMAVKATDTSFSSDDPHSVVIADCSGELINGARPATKEAVLHGAIYAARADVNAIVHCHSPWAVGWSLTGEAIPNVTYHSALKLAQPVPVIDTGSYAVAPEQIEDVLALFASSGARAVMLQGHGLVSVGVDIDDALCTAELVEETAHIAFVSRMLHR
ncbi:class II aldolase/adducin family protein [Agromyces laixinhei]|uniref:class II aldolase/adducin family protein n=1 Tax=Agromyces laixinhei TaxID=2585717 RepID=UPI0012ED20A9|nr:class II aldolase/adducin family protein [Agromyces laixinhei]